MKPGSNEKTGRKMKSRQKNREKIVEDPPTTFEGLKRVGDIQQCFKKQVQAQAHELQFQTIMREVVTRCNIELAQTEKHCIQP